MVGLAAWFGRKPYGSRASLASHFDNDPRDTDCQEPARRGSLIVYEWSAAISWVQAHFGRTRHTEPYAVTRARRVVSKREQRAHREFADAS